ncbi:recombinase RecT [Acinetobacter soli]|uniref:recombinase RecT n=1 Tax=Acinetobacter soli TaxID=487316 RepID=UPI001D0B2F51|nr:recombinase RecT [Acinetobacter soli]MCB8770141.1 recombinase RecT [Acinetobacter soli]
MNAPVKSENQLANNEPATIKQYVSDSKIRQKFEEVLGKKTQGFLASVMQVANQSQLKGAVPATVINAAMMAATLDLPINNNLGFAYIVPYKRKFKNGQGQWTETLEAQFQMGYKGFIQLAQRSGQFARIAATPVYQGQLISANPLLGYEFDWTVENKGEAIGYVAFFKLLNGFTAELYMSTADVKKHAGKYSQSFKYGSGVWKDNFEAMALKTVTKLLLSKQAPLSIDMQTAQLADQSIVHDVENNDFEYIDHSDAVAAIEQKPTVPDNEFPVLIEQIRAGALEKDYVFGEYQLTDDQTAKVHAL